MTGEINKRYVLHPNYHLRNDIHRIVLFSRVAINDDCSRGWSTFIHPFQAILLSFFTHDRSFEEVLNLASVFFSRSVTDIKKMVSGFIENSTPVYAQLNGLKIYFPKQVLIDVEKAGDAVRFAKLNPNEFTCQKLDLTTRRLYSGPLMLTIMLTNRCATRCEYCYADTSTLVKHPLSTSRILELIHEAAQMQVQQVNLIGGELFLHRDWKVILKDLVRRDIAPEFISTKMPMTAKRLEELKETGYKNIIQISLDACDSKLLQTSLHISNHYTNAMLKGIRLLDESGLKYQIASVLTTYNCNIKTISELFCFLSTLKNIRDWRIIPVSNSITKDYQEFATIKPSKEQIQSLFDYLERIVLSDAAFPVILAKDAINKHYYQDGGGSCHFKGSACSALNTHMFVLPDGNVTICEQLYWHPHFIIGNVVHSSLKQVWNSPKALQLCSLSRNDISEKSKCKKCIYFETCFSYQNRCWSNIIKAYGDDCWDFPDPRCPYAPVMKNNLGYE